MKGTALTWEQLKQQDPKQTAAIVTYQKGNFKRVRVLLKKWMSRDEAWYWCQDNNIRRYQEEMGAMITAFRLLRLSKVVKELDATRPKDVSAIFVA